MKAKILALIAFALMIPALAHAEPYPRLTGELSYATTESLGTAVTDNIASSGNVYHLSCYNNNAAARFIQLYNSTDVNDATKLRLSVLVPATNMVMIGPNELGGTGMYFPSGITWGFSTAANSFTGGAAADATVFVSYNKRYTP